MKDELLKELELKRSQLDREIQEANYRKGDAESKVEQLSKDAEAAEIATYRRGADLREEEMLLEVSLKLEDQKVLVKKIAAEILDLQDQFNEVDNQISSIKAKAERFRRDSIERENRQSFEDLASREATLSALTRDENDIIQKLHAAVLEYDRVRAEGSAPFNSIEKYDRRLHELGIPIKQFEERRDQLRRQKLPLEKKIQEIRSFIEMKFQEVR